MLSINTTDYSCHCSCGESFLDFEKVGVHLGTHTWNHFQCGNCYMEIKQIDAFLEHMRMYHLKAIFQCKLCFIKFSLEHELKVHMQCHGVSKCKFCFKTFSCTYETHLQESQECKANWLGRFNLKTFTTNDVFECAICCADFTTQNDFLTHSMVHTNGRLCQCSVCSKEYQNFGQLVLHMPVHSTDKPFACPICNNTFKRRSNLKCHRRICGHSDNEWSNSNDLITHLEKSPSDMGDESLSQLGESQCSQTNADTKQS